MKRYLFIFTLLAVLAMCAVPAAAADGVGAEDYLYSASGGNITLTKYFGEDESEIIIPAEIDGMPVTKIGEKCFEDHEEIERVILLRCVDRRWMNHIDDMEQLRQGIGLQAYGQKNPVVEFKMQGFDMFESMTAGIQEDTVQALLHIRQEQRVEREQVAKAIGTNRDDSVTKAPVKRADVKIYPNDPCPCGSGKKYKQCHGRK